MKRSGIIFSILILFLQPVAHSPVIAQVTQDGGTTLYLPLLTKPSGQPTLKWAYGGCYVSWCETGWYSSPAAINIDADPQLEVIASAYSVWALDGINGSLEWRFDPAGSRTWPGIVLTDLERDGSTEIVVAQGGGWVSAINLNGTLKWQKQFKDQNDDPIREFRGLLVADLENNASNRELLVTAAIGSRTSTWVLESNGSTRTNWPQITSETSGYAYGVFNANAAVANLSGDSALEIIIPTDVHYILGLHPNGAPLASNNSVYPGNNRTVWGQVGVWEDLEVEIRGWGNCLPSSPRSEKYRPNFAHTPATLADLDGNGSLEIVVTGNVYDCSQNPYQSRYTGLFIFKADRTRYQNGSDDWRTTPLDIAPLLSEDYNVIENVQPNPVVADLDGDGRMEILFPAYDGRMHAFWLDKTEKGNWPYSVYNPAEGFLRFASEPVVVDLENDGLAEVIFTSWTQKGSNRSGKLHILNAFGVPLYEIDLPPGRNGNWNGGLPAPTLANIDNDPDLEVIVNTAYSGVVAYDLPGSAAARILWATGRGNYQRTGSLLANP